MTFLLSHPMYKITSELSEIIREKSHDEGEIKVGEQILKVRTKKGSEGEKIKNTLSIMTLSIQLPFFEV